MKKFFPILLLMVAGTASLPAVALSDSPEITLDPICRYAPVKGDAPCGDAEGALHIVLPRFPF